MEKARTTCILSWAMGSPSNNFFPGGTVPQINFFPGGTVPTNSHFLN